MSYDLLCPKTTKQCGFCKKSIKTTASTMRFRAAMCTKQLWSASTITVCIPTIHGFGLVSWWLLRFQPYLPVNTILQIRSGDLRLPGWDTSLGYTYIHNAVKLMNKRGIWICWFPTWILHSYSHLFYAGISAHLWLEIRETRRAKGIMEKFLLAANDVTALAISQRILSNLSPK